jgi:hypothetical protein
MDVSFANTVSAAAKCSYDAFNPKSEVSALI